MRYLVLLTLILGSFITGSAQDYKKVSDALTEGNASALGKCFDSTVEMTMNEKVINVGRGDAENKMRTFFIENETRNFDMVHKGVSQNDVHYMIGQLGTSGGAYRITIYMHKAVNDYVIQSIEIEQD